MSASPGRASGPRSRSRSPPHPRPVVLDPCRAASSTNCRRRRASRSATRRRAFSQGPRASTAGPASSARPIPPRLAAGAGPDRRPGPYGQGGLAGEGAAPPPAGAAAADRGHAGRQVHRHAFRLRGGGAHLPHQIRTGSVAAVDGNKLTVDFDKAGRKMVLDSFVQPGSIEACPARGPPRQTGSAIRWRPRPSSRSAPASSCPPWSMPCHLCVVFITADRAVPHHADFAWAWCGATIARSSSAAYPGGRNRRTCPPPASTPTGTVAGR